MNRRALGRAAVLAACLAAGTLGAQDERIPNLPETAAGSTIPAASALSGTAPVSATLISDGAVSSTLVLGAPVSSTFLRMAPAGAGSATTGEGAPAPKDEKPKEDPRTIRFEELHKRTRLAIMPTAYAAHIHRETGENLRIFLAWYIGTIYNEEGLFIAPIFSLLVGVDAKWAFIEEKRGRPGMAMGYLGGYTMPFTGGSIRSSMALNTPEGGESGLDQAFIHNFYGVLSKRFGPVAFSAGAMYGLKDCFARVYPMLRNSSYSTVPNPVSELRWTAFTGVDVTFRKKHINIEVITMPEEILPAYDRDVVVRPWLIQSRVDAFLGFDLAYLRDRVGYEIVGYYVLPFARWPNKKRLDKEVERARARETGAISAP